MTRNIHTIFSDTFLDRRIASIFLLGIAQGLPWVMIGSMLTIWLQETGISRTNIGFASLIFLAYAINFLWSPVVETVKLKIFPHLGHRQSWIFLCLIVISACCIFISTLSPELNASKVVAVGLVIAVFSATQDIAIDAYRVDSFSTDESDKISAASAAATSGWWTGYAGIGAIPLFLSDSGWSWPNLYLLLGGIAIILALANICLPGTKISHSVAQKEKYLESVGLVSAISKQARIRVRVYFVGMIVCIVLVVATLFSIAPSFVLAIPSYSILALALFGVLCAELNALGRAPTPSAINSTFSLQDKVLAWLVTALVLPIQSFFSRNGAKFAIQLLIFIFLFKVGEAFLGRMSVVFYKEIGFSNSQIATYAKLVTWWLTIIFSVLGALVNARFGLFRGLFVSGVAMASTNLLFSVLATIGPNESFFALAIILDGFSQAWSTVAFVALISLVCDHAFSATQYALMASLGNLSRTTLASGSGYFVDLLGGNWALFFVITALMVIPSLVTLWLMKNKVELFLSSTHVVGTTRD